MKKNTTFNLRSSFLEDIKLMIQGNTLSYSTSIEKACSEKQREKFNCTIRTVAKTESEKAIITPLQL